MNVMKGVNPTKIVKNDDGSLVVSFDGDVADLVVDEVMWATGRVPNTDRPDLGLSEVGVELDSKGAVVVDDYSQTTVPSIWAVGDVTNRMNLTPVALMEGMAFKDTVVLGKPTKPDYENIASAVFSQPPVATVGLTEEQAVAAGMTCDVYTSTFTPMKISLAGRVVVGICEIGATAPASFSLPTCCFCTRASYVAKSSILSASSAWRLRSG